LPAGPGGNTSLTGADDGSGDEMTWQRLVGGVLVCLAVAAGLMFRYARANDVDLPTWAWVLGIAAAAGCVAFAIWHGRQEVRAGRVRPASWSLPARQQRKDARHGGAHGSAGQ
jgi:hypothetical protein